DGGKQRRSAALTLLQHARVEGRDLTEIDGRAVWPIAGVVPANLAADRNRDHGRRVVVVVHADSEDAGELQGADIARGGERGGDRRVQRRPLTAGSKRRGLHRYAATVRQRLLRVIEDGNAILPRVAEVPRIAISSPAVGVPVGGVAGVAPVAIGLAAVHAVDG